VSNNHCITHDLPNRKIHKSRSKLRTPFSIFQAACLSGFDKVPDFSPATKTDSLVLRVEPCQPTEWELCSKLFRTNQ
jgi:hypothetical protein